MNDVIKAVILGVVEGLTEFLPVSSTGHLILVEHLLKLEAISSETFSIVIQLGAILAVVWLYFDHFSIYLKPKNWFGTDAKRIYIAILPALILGFFFYSTIKSVLFMPFYVAIALIVGGILMLLIERFVKVEVADHKQIGDISLRSAFTVGIWQCLSLWPGMSRSASTIMGGLVSGIDHRLAASFSFIIAVPVMVCAVSYDLYKSFDFADFQGLYLILIGFLVSFIVAVGAIKSFLTLLQKWKLMPFAWYRICLGVLVLYVYYK